MTQDSHVRIYHRRAKFQTIVCLIDEAKRLCVKPILRLRRKPSALGS
jgi:hypothetical protein